MKNTRKSLILQTLLSNLIQVAGVLTYKNNIIWVWGKWSNGLNAFTQSAGILQDFSKDKEDV